MNSPQQSQYSRPVYLNLFRLHLPLPGWISILHRVTGVLLFLGLPVCLALLQKSLSGMEGFAETGAWLKGSVGALFAWLMVVSLAFHAFAGLRHLALDLHCGVQRHAARRSAVAVLALSGLAALLAAWGLAT